MFSDKIKQGTGLGMAIVLQRVHFIMFTLIVPQESGSNENNNKLIRKFIKKKTDIKNFSIAYNKKIQDWMNNYPRKLFNYKSANDIFYENLNNCLNCCNRF